MRLWNDPKERNLLLLVIILFAVLCVIEGQYELVSCLNGTRIGGFLVSQSVKDISSGLIVSVLAAYFFYLFIDFIPRQRKEQSTKIVLDSLLASVLDAFNRCRVFGHETPISHVDKAVLNESWLNEQKANLKSGTSNFLPLKFAMQTAFTRLEDFRHALPLAVSLSPDMAMKWLVIIDKVRLFAESYGEQPEVPEDKILLIDTDSDENPLKLYKADLNFRLLELVEQAIEWREFKCENNG